MFRFYSYLPYDGSTPIISPDRKNDWDITAKAKSAKVEVIRLSVQANQPVVIRHAHWMAITWSPKWARSYNIVSFRHTDYYSLPVESPTGYASFSVIYYSRSNEGRFIVTEHKPGSWDNFPIVSTLDHKLNLNTCR